MSLHKCRDTVNRYLQSFQLKHSTHMHFLWQSMLSQKLFLYNFGRQTWASNPVVILSALLFSLLPRVKCVPFFSGSSSLFGFVCLFAFISGLFRPFVVVVVHDSNIVYTKKVGAKLPRTVKYSKAKI